MRRTYRKRTGRKRRTMKTLKIRGGNLDDPDTKDFVNSKIEALEQKITELESNMPVQIGYKVLAYHSPAINQAEPSYTPLVVNKNISIQDFWKYVGKGNINYGHYQGVTIFLPALYSLPNVRGLNIEDCSHSFETGNIPENKELRKRNLDALNAKYPGLFAL
jgi:hypothetical protein